MATIIRSSAPIVGGDLFNEADTYAANYWGDLANERMFPIAFWQVSQMLQASNSNEIALRVVNINSPLTVTAKWITFEESLAETLKDPVESGVYYFVLNGASFNGPIYSTLEPGLQYSGMVSINSNPQNNIIRGRIGKNTETGRFYAFLQAAECQVVQAVTRGPGGATTGVKIPANGQ